MTPAKKKTEWSGSPCPIDPDNCWVDDETGEHVNAKTCERARKHKKERPRIYLGPVTTREFHTVLASLRLRQADMDDLPADVEAVASNCGQCQPLTSEEIDDLIERLN